MKRLRGMLPYIIATAVVAVIVWLILPSSGSQTQTMKLGTLWSELANHDVQQAVIASDGSSVNVTLTNGKVYDVRLPSGYATDMTNQFRQAGVKNTRASAPSIWSNAIVSTVVFFVLWIGAMVLIFGFGSQLVNKLVALRSSRAHLVAERPSTRFSDVAGCPEVVGELRELVDQLKYPERYADSGVEPARGMLLSGEPGTGKTLLARAVAGEANVPFYSVSGSEFVEKYVGVGAARVRQLFGGSKRGRKSGLDGNFPRVIIVDEVEAIGTMRSGSSDGGAREHDQTLTQLLKEMDGFDPSSGAIVLAATNLPKSLDPALLRRFDREIVVPLPDVKGREEILNMYRRGRQFADDVDLRATARQTPGFSGERLKNLMNQAAKEAFRDAAAQSGPNGAKLGAVVITAAHLQAALATLMLGSERIGAEVVQQDREITACHEAGHAIVGLLQSNLPDPTQVEIVPRGSTGGVTWMVMSDELLTMRSVAVAQLVRMMGGRGAEKLYYNGDYTQGAASDREESTKLALQMVCLWGMADTVPMTVPIEDWQYHPLADEISDSVAQLLCEAEAEATRLLTEPAEHRSVLDELRGELLEKERIGPEGMARYKAMLGIAPTPQALEQPNAQDTVAPSLSAA